MPVGITFWIQLLSVSAYETKLRLTLDADMSMMIKMMVNKKLQEGINQLADMLAALAIQVEGFRKESLVIRKNVKFPFPKF